MISSALRDALAADAALVADLATYEFTDGSPEAAIFTTERIPDDCGYPAVIIDDIGGTPWGCRGNRGGEAFARARVYGDKNWNLERVRSTAWKVQRALDRVALDGYLSGYDYAGALCIADPPAFLADPDGFPGFVVNVRTMVLET